jgi:hypothetical protein
VSAPVPAVWATLRDVVRAEAPAQFGIRPSPPAAAAAASACEDSEEEEEETLDPSAVAFQGSQRYSATAEAKAGWTAGGR